MAAKSHQGRRVGRPLVQDYWLLKKQDSALQSWSLLLIDDCSPYQLPKRGHLYFGQKGTFLLWVDTNL
jgi:hypothetical protein